MLKKNIFVLLFFAGLALLVYRNCFDIFIPADNYSIFYLLDHEGISGAIKNFGPYLFLFPLIFGLYKLIAASAFGWIGISLLLHVLNAYLVFLFTKKAVDSLLKITSPWMPFFAGVLFLISPYQTEAILWTPTNLGFLVATAFSLLSLFLILKYFESRKESLLYSSLLFFAFAAYSWETSFILPGVSLVIYLLYYFQQKTNLSVRHFSIKILAPQIAIILSYLVVTKLLFGDWFWHSGSMDIDLSFTKLAGTTEKYAAKFLIFYRYLHLSEADDLLRKNFGHPGYILMIFAAASVIYLALFSFFIRQKNIKAIFTMTIFLCFIIALIPVLPLDSSFLKYIYPDRYGYLPSAFFYIFLTSCMFFLFKKFAPSALIACSILCWALLAQTISKWELANEYCTHLIKNYTPFLKYDKVYVLNIPAYHNGFAAFRSAFPEAIYTRYDKSSTDKIEVISGSYEESPADSLVAVSISGNDITVNGQKKKSPFFSTGGGWAQSYQTNEYSVKFDSTRCSYTLSFKHEIPKNSAFIYTSSGTWKKADNTTIF